MASSNHAPQIGLPSSSGHASSETPDQILANFQEIFSSQIEPDVVLLIFTECDFNVNATLECLFALIGESPEGKFNKEQSDLRTSTSSGKPSKNCTEATSEKSIYKNRLSTIYKSNEGLYSDDVALNGEELNQFPDLTPLHGAIGRPSNSQFSNCSDATQKTQTAGLSLNLCTANSDVFVSPHHPEQASSGSKFRRPFLNEQSALDPQAKWNGVSDIGVFSVIQDPISPYSDKSIEADASEHINADVVSQPSITDCNSLATFDDMASKPSKKGKQQQQDAQSSSWWGNLGQAAAIIAEAYGQKPASPKPKSQGGQPKRTPNKPATQQNPQVKKNQATQPHWKRQVHHNQKPMNPKEQVIMRIADGQKVLVLLRGCPGSGKTTLGNEIKFKGVVYSADNFFMRNGEYCFDPGRLPEAHTRTKFLTMRAMQAGRTPIIIDNTNLLTWEMEPYVALALQNRYYITLLEPSTSWRYDPRQLTMKNTHNIGYDKIVNMLQRFDHKVTVRSMIEQYMANNRSPPNVTSNRVTTPNPTVKSRPRPRKKNIPKVNLETPQAGAVQSANGGPPDAYGGLEGSDSDTDSDSWSKISNSGQQGFYDLPTPNEKLKKSKSVPDLLRADNMTRNISLFKDSFVDFELSENMRDLLDLDFSPIDVQTPTDTENPNRNHADSTHQDTTVEPLEPHARIRIGRLAAAFKDLPPDWDVPEYPSGFESSRSDGAKSETRLILSQEGLASSTASLERDLASVPDESANAKDATSELNEVDQISALKSFFANVPDEYLKDLLDKCKGDLPWVVDLLLDAGYEMCVEKPVEDFFQKSGSSLEGLAEISPDAKDAAESPDTDQSAKESFSGLSDPSSVDETIQGGSDKEGKMFLRIDPIFAMQLQDMFGPVGFHLSPASYYGSDLGIFIPTAVARSIHGCWANSLKAKFESEDAEIDKMMDRVALDENYAKLVQEEEDRILATTLQSDPLGEHFPPLETKHVLITLEKSNSKTEDLASRIKRRQLYEMFPKIDRKALDDVFNANNASFSETVQAIEVSFCPDQKPTLVIAPEQLEEYERALVKFAEQESLLLEMGRTKKNQEEVDETDYSEPTYDDWRTEASLHYRLRQECFSKAKEAYDKGMMAAASFYSQQGRVHSQKLHEANKRASEKILESKNAHRKADTLDLHMLHVNEAINALAEFLAAKKQELQRGSNSQATLRIITGRGNHSAMGVPRIKPAVLDFLSKQNYSHCESNGGLIEVILRK